MLEVGVFAQDYVSFERVFMLYCLLNHSHIVNEIKAKQTCGGCPSGEYLRSVDYFLKQGGSYPDLNLSAYDFAVKLNALKKP